MEHWLTIMILVICSYTTRLTEQMAQSKAEEIESLLDRLSDVNSSMSSQLTGANDSHAHTVARHRDILAEFTQVCFSEAVS